MKTEFDNKYIQVTEPERPSMRDFQKEKQNANIHLINFSEVHSSIGARLQILSELSERLLRDQAFETGQIVKWKPGLKNRRFPAYCEPMIVTQILTSPVFDPSEDAAGSPFFREPLNIVVAVYHDDDGSFLEYHLDRRRLEVFADEQCP